MTAMEGLLRRQAVGEDLHSVVRVMKSLSAVSIKQFDAAANILRDYQSALLLGLQANLRQSDVREVTATLSPAVDAYILVGSDRGLCGRFNETIAYRAKAKFDDTSSRDRETFFLTVGVRAAERMTALGVHSGVVLSAPAVVAALSDTVEILIMHIDQRCDAVNLGQVVVIYNARTDDELASVTEQTILPVTEAWLMNLRDEPWPARGLPDFTVKPDELFSKLIREHLFLGLFRAVAESVASEHASRLAAMQRAERHIDEFLATLGAKIRDSRQNSITQELLDIVASYDVLRSHRASILRQASNELDCMS